MYIYSDRTRLKRSFATTESHPIQKSSRNIIQCLLSIVVTRSLATGRVHTLLLAIETGKDTYSMHAEHYQQHSYTVTYIPNDPTYVRTYLYAPECKELMRPFIIDPQPMKS